MDAKRFDSATRILTDALSRRSALASLGGGFLALLGGVDTGAKRRRRHAARIKARPVGAKKGKGKGKKKKKKGTGTASPALDRCASVLCDAVPNGATGCVDGVCVLTACSAGFSNCDGLLSSGCEHACPTCPAVPTPVVISQIYGGSGLMGAAFKNDFIELFNRSTSPVNLAGWSVQYSPASGSATWLTTVLGGTLAPGQYYLVREAGSAFGGTDLPPADAAGSINLSSANGRVALVSSVAPLTCEESPSCVTAPDVVDFVGYGATTSFEGLGAAPALTSSTAVLRRNLGRTETNDNAADFVSGTPTPRNRATTAISPCG